MKENNKKENILKKHKDTILRTIYVFLILGITIFGISFAWYSFTNPNIDVSGVTSNWCSGLDVTASGGVITNASLGSPVAAYNTGNREPSTDFTITNNETESIVIDISLIDISMDSALKSQYFMYTLTDGTNVISEGNFSNVNLGNGSSLVIKSGLTISASSTNTYYLYLWIKNNGGDQNDIQNKTFSGKIKINISSSFCNSYRSLVFVNRQNQNSITTGDELKVATEHFYVLSSNSTETVLLSKYNLYVGDIYNSYGNVYQRTISSTESGYGLQNAGARGYVEDQTQIVGVVDFSNTNYWADSGGGLLSEYGNRYFADVYDDSSNLYQYVEDYVDKLNEMGLLNITGRLICDDEAYYYLLCNAQDEACEGVFGETSSYWTGTAYDDNDILVILNGTYYGIDYGYEGDPSFGVRPVIVVPTSSIS